MRQQAPVQTKKEIMPSQMKGILQHASVHTIPQHEKNSSGLGETQFGHDFSQVRTHSSTNIDRSAVIQNAGSHTNGQNNMFSSSQLLPFTNRERRMHGAKDADVAQLSGSNGSRIVQNSAKPGLSPKSRNRGEPLDAGTHHFLTSSFQRRFDDVRIYHGLGDVPKRGIAAARGNDLSFSPSLNQSPSFMQKAVIAHEAVHALQRQRADQSSAPRWNESRLEDEARTASLCAVQGRTYNVQGIDRENRPRFHPIFISTHGTQGFLNNAREFYTRWGYGAPVPVSSIEETVGLLANGTGHVDRMTIISHAVPDNINISFLRGGPGFVHQSEWAITTRQSIPDYSGHATPVDLVNRVINSVRTSSPNNAALLQRLSLDYTQPMERQFVWWLVDADFIRSVPPANAIPNRGQVRARAQQNAGHYRERLRERFQFISQFDSSAQPDDINNLEQSINAVLNGYAWDPINVRTGRAIRNQILSGREGAVQRVLDQQFGPGVVEPFQLSLMFAQNRFDAGSTIEIKGCRIGQNRGYLEGISRFFGGGNNNPTVTAPDMFQVFGNMGLRIHPDRTNRLRRLWNNQSIRRAFVYWAGVFGWRLSDPPVADDLVNALRAGHAFAVGANLHCLAGHDPGNVVAWFARFSYHLSQAPVIGQAFFTDRTTSQGVRFTIVDWMQDARPGQNPNQILFPPDPEYQNHIQSAQAGAAQVLP